MKCIFVCSGEYPDNQASAIRHTLIARGLAERGLDVELWMLTPQPWAELERDRSHGLRFLKLNGLKGAGGRLKRAAFKLSAVFSAVRRTISLAIEHKRSQAAVIVFYCTEVEFLAPMMTVAKLFGLPMVHERTEFPYVVAKKTAYGRFSLSFYLSYLLPMFHRVMVINDELGRYIKRFNPNVEKLLTVVDVKEFRTTEAWRLSAPYVAYCGTMYGHKDGLDILVQAFGAIHAKFPAWRLVLVGDNSRVTELAALLELIEKVGLRDKVVFTGRVDRSEVPVILRSAKILALAKPSNEQNAGNFPIKLGEYLATGVPVLVTNVGEIPKFIVDGVTGYLSQPDAESFATRLEYVICHLSEAAEVGGRGSNLAERLFAYEAQAGVLARAIDEVAVK